jgi:HEPN domain-containing protein
VGSVPTRAEWQQLAEDRILDAQALFAAGRWSGAYYLVGYAVECGLKACVLARVGAHPEVVYEERRFAQDAWTHDLERLVILADLKTARDTDAAANVALRTNWQWVLTWSEESRYEQHGQPEAQDLLNAVIDPNNGVMQWIRVRW